jgi:hypothetical protein
LEVSQIYRDLFFSLRGEGALFGRGSVRTTWHRPDLTSNEIHVDLQSDSWTSRGEALFGCGVDLTSGRTYQTFLTPLVGYLGAYRNEQTQHSTTFQEGALSFSFVSNPSYRYLWFGPLVGAALFMRPYETWTLDLIYRYQWRALSMRGTLSERVLQSEELTLSERPFTYRHGDAFAHLGNIQTKWRLGSRVWWGLSGSFSYAETARSKGVRGADIQEGTLSLQQSSYTLSLLLSWYL